MRAFFGLLATLLVVAVVIGIGASIYNAGVSAGLAEVVAASGEAIPVDRFADGSPYIDGPAKFGFGIMGMILGLLFSLLLIVIIVGLARIAFSGRMGNHGSHGWGARRERLEELHRELHRGDGPDGEQRPAGA